MFSTFQMQDKNRTHFYRKLETILDFYRWKLAHQIMTSMKLHPNFYETPGKKPGELAGLYKIWE